MIYEEKAPNKILSVIFLIAAFVILYSPWSLNIRELFSDEGKYLAIAMEMNFLKPSTIAHGELLANTYPLFPYIVAIFYKMGLPLEACVRLPSVICLGILTVTVFITSLRISGMQGALTAAAFMMSSLLVMTKGYDGKPFTMGVTLILIGWLIWYYQAAYKGAWNKAWIYSSICCSLAFFAIGGVAIFYFYFPLIFSRRPLTIWKKLNTWGFKTGVFIILFCLFIWYVPRQVSKTPITMLSGDTFLSLFTIEYFGDLFAYPVQVVYHLTPWFLIAWPAFCVAYQPLDKNPIFSRFLRTIFLSLFFVFWLNPDKNTQNNLILIAPLAIMAGINYWLVIRRNGYHLRLLTSLMTFLLTLYSIAMAVFFAIPPDLWSSNTFLILIHNLIFKHGIAFFAQYSHYGIIQTSLAAALGIIALLFRNKLAIWIQILVISLIFMICFWAAIIPYRSQGDDARQIAVQVISDLGESYSPEMTIYKGPEIADMYVLGSYLGCKIKKITSYDQIPSSEKTVYVLTLGTPIFPDRQWTRVSSPTYNRNIIYLWKGVEAPKKLIGSDI